jgi:hypothetical protein
MQLEECPRVGGDKRASRATIAEGRRREGGRVSGANIRVFFLTIGVLALLVLAFLLAAPAFAGGS